MRKFSTKSLIESVRENKMFRIADLFLVLIVIAVVILVVVFALAPTGNTVEIFEDGKLLKTLNLSENSRFEIEGKLTVVTENGEVHVEDATCPDKLCEHGRISSAGMSIVCLPNNIVIVIRGEEGIDALTSRSVVGEAEAI